MITQPLVAQPQRRCPGMLAAALALLFATAACGNEDGHDERGAETSRAATQANGGGVERPEPTAPNLERFVGHWELHELEDAEGRAWEGNGALWFEMALHEDGRFQAVTQWISDEPLEEANFREAAFYSVVSDRLGLRIESRGLWTAVWDGEAGELTLSLRFKTREDRPSRRANGEQGRDAGEVDATEQAAQEQREQYGEEAREGQAQHEANDASVEPGEARADAESGGANAERKHEITLRAELVGQRGRFMRLAGHPVHRGVARTLLRRVE